MASLTGNHEVSSRIHLLPELHRPVERTLLAEICLLTGLAGLLLVDTARGLLAYYIHPRYTPLVVISGLLLLAMAAVRARGLFALGSGRPPVASPERTATCLMLLLPLFLATVVPAQPLGADAVAGAGARLLADPRWNGLPAATDSRAWTLLDWAAELNARGRALAGTPVRVDGFVFHPQGLGRDSFDVGRTVVTCCVADSSCVGLPVTWPDGAGLATDGWVSITGTLNWVGSGDQVQPTILAASVIPIKQPNDPYLYP